jgi:hypothetical protein
MPLYLPDLDRTTRECMLQEFDREQATLPYISPVLSAYGRSVWPSLMREAIEMGDDVSLFNDLLAVPSVFIQQESYRRQGVTRMRTVNARQAAERLATSEFNTWYVRVSQCASLLKASVTSWSTELQIRSGLSQASLITKAASYPCRTSTTVTALPTGRPTIPAPSPSPSSPAVTTASAKLPSLVRPYLIR